MSVIKKRSTYYRKRGQKDLQLWFKHCKKSFSKGFTEIAGISYNGKLKIRKVAKKCKNELYLLSKERSNSYF